MTVLRVSDEIFERFPEVVLGVVTAHEIWRSLSRATAAGGWARQSWTGGGGRLYCEARKRQSAKDIKDPKDIKDVKDTNSDVLWVP